MSNRRWTSRPCSGIWANCRGWKQPLVRLDSSAFGECIDCGVDIPFARLAAQLHATRCIACQTRHEREHGGVERPTL
ncbi:MAG: TraR/DksA family transcriptional regulator [Betaproteobacteria bacterium]|nr:TraR/DksA family transcriptional regulator [Betaproteobacteria bacterium]